MNLSALINMKGFTVGRFSTASRIQETRMKEIIAGDPASVEEAWNMSKVLGMTPGDLYQYLRTVKSWKKEEDPRMKRLFLDDICKLQKASVIWMEIHDKDTENGLNHYKLYPLLVCVSGEGGVLAYADNEQVITLDINDQIFDHGRIYWDKEPDPTERN